MGSSPLTRGKLRRLGRCRTRCGLIPAHAGKTVTTGQMQVVNGAHPRSRGENSPARPRSRAGQGSSPLTRGKPGPTSYAGNLTGLIPAHAGKTASRPHESCSQAAHPRSRGEN